VFVVTQDSKAELRPVQVGQRQDEMVVVEGGLKAGERVVTVGHMGVMPGGPVQVAPPPNPAPKAAPASADPANAAQMSTTKPAAAVAEGAVKS
jgi:hypothetical protein